MQLVDMIIERVYRVEIEEADDIAFTAEALVLVFADGQFVVYAGKPMHNRIRAVLHKYPWTQLTHGVVVRGAEYRLADLTAQMKQRGWTTASTIPAMVRQIFDSNPRQYYFLRHYL